MQPNRIRELRKATGITQDNLASMLGVNRATISKYETGQIEITITRLQSIANALGVHILDLLGIGEQLDKHKVEISVSPNANISGGVCDGRCFSKRNTVIERKKIGTIGLRSRYYRYESYRR